MRTGEATTATATADPPSVLAPGEELEKVRQRVLTVLGEDDAPVQGLPTRRIRSRIRGQHKGRLLEALWTLQEDGLLTVRPILYRNRPGLLWTLTDPLVPLSNVLA